MRDGGIEVIVWLIFAAIFAAIVAGIVFAVTDFAFGTTYTAEVGVVEKHYEPSHNNVGVTSNGKTVTTFEDETYTLIVARDGNVVSRTVTAAEYAAAQPGQPAMIRFRRGWLTGMDW
jgi:hypothetical protein